MERSRILDSRQIGKTNFFSGRFIRDTWTIYTGYWTIYTGVKYQKMTSSLNCMTFFLGGGIVPGLNTKNGEFLSTKS
jgi:hypothetical protein